LYLDQLVRGQSITALFDAFRGCALPGDDLSDLLNVIMA
jgi:hypothetical protein